MFGCVFETSDSLDLEEPLTFSGGFEEARLLSAGLEFRGSFSFDLAELGSLLLDSLVLGCVLDGSDSLGLDVLPSFSGCFEELSLSLGLVLRESFSCDLEGVCSLLDSLTLGLDCDGLDSLGFEVPRSFSTGLEDVFLSLGRDREGSVSFCLEDSRGLSSFAFDAAWVPSTGLELRDVLS